MPPEHLKHKLQRFEDAVTAASRLEHSRLEKERELQDLKWLGYRFMTPLAATKLFYETYWQHRLVFIKENIDIELARSTREVPFEAFTKTPSSLARAWSARQTADIFGVPYDIYIGFSVWFWSRRSGGGRRWAPQINQLGFKPSSETAWRAEFEKYRNDRMSLRLPELASVPQLHSSVFEGTSEQVAARRFIIDHCVASSESWAPLIERWCYKYPLLTTDCFKSVVPPEPLGEALRAAAAAHAESATKQPVLLEGSLWPSCHGMIGARDPATITCSKCKFADSCGRMASLVMTEVACRTGHEQPRKKELRSSPNARMRAFRARKKAAAASGSPTSSSLLPEATLAGGDA